MPPPCPEELVQGWAPFCFNLHAFMWRKIEPKSIFVEKRWQISDLWPTWVISKCCCVCKKLFERGEDNASIIELNKNIDLISVVGQDELVCNGRHKKTIQFHDHICTNPFLTTGCGRSCWGSLVGGEKKCYRGSKNWNRHKAGLFSENCLISFQKPTPMSTLTAIFVENPISATFLLSLSSLPGSDPSQLWLCHRASVLRPCSPPFWTVQHASKRSPEVREIGLLFFSFQTNVKALLKLGQ